MISLDKTQTYLLELLKASLFELPPVLHEDANWDEIFELARKQCIVPLAMSCVPEVHRGEWLSITYQSKARFMRLLHEQNSLVNLFNDNGIHYVILKGTAAAIYYPIPALRTFGDIDFYVHNAHSKTARIILEKNGYKFIAKDDRHYEFEKNYVNFELHTRFSSQQYNDIDHLVHNCIDNPVEHNICGVHFCALPTCINGLVLLGHIMRHLKTYGIGLRQIIDWMMFVHNELDDVTWKENFMLLSREAGLEKLAITVTFMCKKWLGLPNEITWCDSADEEVADQLLLRILNDGNFGRERLPFENVKVNINKDGLFSYLQRSGMENWQLAKKYVVFRPFAWLYQICRYACLGFIGLFSGKKVFRKANQNMSLEELWKRLE